MIKLAKRQTLHLWIAMLAILFGALAPTISRAIAADAPAALLEMCSVSATKATGADGGKAPATPMQGMDHCAFCSIHSGDNALPTTPATQLAIDAGRSVYPPLFYSAPQPLHIWSAANPRAPPFLA